jgi:hypothetical protein
LQNREETSSTATTLHVCETVMLKAINLPKTKVVRKKDVMQKEGNWCIFIKPLISKF